MSTATAKKKGGKQENETALVGVQAGDDESTETEEPEEVETAEETKAPEITSEELAQKTAAEKLRLEDTLCTQADWLADATVEFNNANNHAKECKKHLESVQVKVNETFTKLADVLSGNWRPDPQRELPFPDQSGEVGTQMDLSLWRSEPVTTLGLSDALNAKLDQEGFPTLGTIADEIAMYDPPFGNTEMGPGQVKKIVAAFKEFDDKRLTEKPATETESSEGTSEQ